jgi:MOSC domain-containing protein YiiM
MAMDRTDLEGCIVSASGRGHHFSKPLRNEITMIEGHGVAGDAHAGPHVRHRHLARRRPHLPNLRQVHLIPIELFEQLRAAGYDVHPGELGENVTTAGLELERLPVGALLKWGATAVIELTGLRTPCVLIDRFQSGLKQRLICRDPRLPSFRCGVLGVVRAGGRLSAGDPTKLPSEPWRMLPAL